MNNFSTNRNRNFKVIIAAVLIGTFSSMPAIVSADEPGGQEAVNHERALQRFDINDNGTLEPREKIHARKVYNRLDRNDDGRVGQRERRIAKRIRSNRDQ